MSLDRKICGTRLSLTPQQSPVSHSSFFPLPGESEFSSPPALVNSLLQLELGLSAFVTDLRYITDVIRADVGLTAQLLRLAAIELGKSPSRVAPLSEIVLLLGVDKLKQLAARTKPIADHSMRSAASGECARFWMHSRLTASIAEELASQSSEVHAEEAYLAGLFFRLGNLPLPLGPSSRSDLRSSDIHALDVLGRRTCSPYWISDGDGLGLSAAVDRCDRRGSRDLSPQIARATRYRRSRR